MPSPATAPSPDELAARARGLATVRLHLGLADHAEGDRRARAEALARGLLSLRQAVERDVIA